MQCHARFLGGDFEIVLIGDRNAKISAIITVWNCAIEESRVVDPCSKTIERA